MDHDNPTSTDDGPRVHQIVELRQYQRRLLFGGGLLLTSIILFAGFLLVWLAIQKFHTEQINAFHDEGSSLKYALTYRARAYAQTVARSESVWSNRQRMLIEAGTPLRGRFNKQGEKLVVRAEGRISIPWLILGRGTAAMPPDRLAAYLGMFEDISAHTATVITPAEYSEPIFAYGYDPSGSLLVVTGVLDESELMRALNVTTRDQIFAMFRAEEARWRLPPIGAYAHDAVTRQFFYYGIDPLDRKPSLAGTQLLIAGHVPYFRRVVFEPVDNLKFVSGEADGGVFAILTSRGEIVRTSRALSAAEHQMISSIHMSTDVDAPTRMRFGRNFLLLGGLQLVDWNLVYLYSWGDVFAVTGKYVALVTGTAFTILSLIWALIWWLDRRVLGPAMATALLVYRSEELSRIIIDTSPVGLSLLDTSHGVPIVENDLARRMALESCADAVPGLYEQLVDRANTHLPATSQEFDWIHAGEGGRHFRVAMVLSSYRSKSVWVCAIRDVSAQAELERSLRKARSDSEEARLAAESASRAKTAFVATMSHEIRTPLNGVLGHLELLSRSKLEQAQKEHLNRIRLSADALLVTISDVLDFSKIEAGQLEIELVTFDLRSVVEQAALLFAPEALRKGVNIYYSIDSSLQQFYASDVHRIRQIINNLLSNAVKFTQSGKIVLSVSQGRHTEAHLCFRVADSGIGMSGDQVAQLFEPFSQADVSISRRYGGSGLGLALCGQLANMLGGSISVESAMGVGSIFTFELPLVPVHCRCDEQRPLEGRRVTLLSEAPEWRAEIGELLRCWGAEVTVLARPVAMPNGAGHLIIFGEAGSWAAPEEARLRMSHERIIHACTDGPLIPEARQDGIYVSCYTSQMLLAAIQAVPIAPRSANLRPFWGSNERGTILLVEDNPVNRELIEQQLKELGFAVDVAADGAAALHKWKPGTYVAVLTDINMPEMNGYELAMALRAQNVDVPILAITATALISEKARCKASGIDELLFKPLGLELLDGALQRHLGPPPNPAMQARRDAATSVEEPTGLRHKYSQRIRHAFVESGRRDYRSFTDALERGDVVELVHVTHAFKGVLLMMGEVDVATQCSKVEASLEDCGIHHLQRDLHDLSLALDAVLLRYELELKEESI
ncbi:hybrid sensor histidine kinase/response regulator [Dyella japonica]|uniref:histidine kinase n=1 Tax=Dyella japonica TaxID=231455 RepID=A0ABV2K1S4_9GAMM